MKTHWILLFTVLYSCQGVSQSFEGVWRGEINVQGMSLPLVFELKDSAGWSGTMQSPAQAQRKFPLTKVLVEGDSVHLELRSMRIGYRGRISSDRQRVEGVFSQAAMQVELILSRSDASDLELGFIRPQDPVLPYPYDTLNVKFRNAYDEVELAGTITQPKEEGRYPAVVLVTGSGPQNRDEELMGHRPFKVIADYLTRNGIVVLRYDDRGVGESTGNFVKSTVNNFSKDASAALSFLKARANVDADRVGMIGHSEGGLITFLLAGQHVADLKFGVALAGPAIPMDSLMVLQLYKMGKSQGMSEEQLADVRPINRRNFDIIKSDVPAALAMQQLRENMKDVPQESKGTFDQEIQVMLMDPYRYFIRIDPIPFIRNIQIPIFAAFGERDVQVPHGENMESLADNLPRHPNTVVKSYPELNHLFQPSKTGAVSEYTEISTTIDEQVLWDIVEWIKGL